MILIIPSRTFLKKKIWFRFLAAPVIIEGNEISTAHSSVIKGNCTAASMEILECLIERETQTQKGSVEYVEVCLAYKTVTIYSKCR